MKNAILLALMFALFALVSEMDYQDALLAHGKTAAECEKPTTAEPAPEAREEA